MKNQRNLSKMQMAPFVRNNKQQVKRKRFERSIAICLIDIYDQAMKGVRRMPWH